MATEKLDLLLRRNKGRSELAEYQKLFADNGFTDLEYVDLEKSDEVLEHIRSIFPPPDQQNELLSKTITWIDSKLLKDTFNKVDDSEKCYLYTDSVSVCGMYMATIKHAIVNSLKIAFHDKENTCFITDAHFRFTFTINYYNIDHIEFKERFDIMRKENMIDSVKY